MDRPIWLLEAETRSEPKGAGPWLAQRLQLTYQQTVSAATMQQHVASVLRVTLESRAGKPPLYLFGIPFSLPEQCHYGEAVRFLSGLCPTTRTVDAHVISCPYPALATLAPCGGRDTARVGCGIDVHYLILNAFEHGAEKIVPGLRAATSNFDDVQDYGDNVA